ncbi:MAG: flagellar biosynthesis anti-sigma factor FlgM [Terriglobia bacterium]
MGRKNGGKVGTISETTLPLNRSRNGKRNFLSKKLEGLSTSKQREFIRIRQLLENVPELRMDKIVKLAKAIDNGTYQVKSEKIAEAIFEKHYHDSSD